MNIFLLTYLKIIVVKYIQLFYYITINGITLMNNNEKEIMCKTYYSFTNG